uniref:crossover junction endonuclease EME1-like isoform X1 n=1 Tax=Styela clava TaxID=7725 RepID=UPI001939790F|nr:crossover junction endonuclease EME1-like isoform X1 [Styela clava]
MTSFGNWQLSSSDSEDEKATNGVLLKVKKKRKKYSTNNNVESNMSDEEYVPLSARLKMKGSNSIEISEEEEDLPVFKIQNNTSTAALTNKENVTSIINSNVQQGIGVKISPCKMNIETLDLTISDDEMGSLNSFPNSMQDIRKKNSPVKSKMNIETLDLTNADDASYLEPVPNAIQRKSPRKNPESEKAKIAKKAEADRRKALNLHLKALKPEECLKYMKVLVSQLIVSMFEDFDFMSELKDGFEPACQRELFDLPCVRWSRKVTTTEVGGQSSEIHDEPEMLVALPASEFVKMVHAQINAFSNDETLTKWVKKLQIENPGINIHLVCHGLEKYNKNLKNKQRREEKRQEKGTTAKRKKTLSVPEVSQDEIEEVLVDLQIECRTTVLYIEKPTELVTMVKQLTKSIGEAPYKRMKRNDVLFINEIPSVKINPKTGEGLKKVWKQMMQQFHNVTPVMATAISDRYPSLLSLIKAYESCGNDTSKAEMLLADIPVRRGVGTLQTSRRIGAELSYKIYRLLMSRISTERLY